MTSVARDIFTAIHEGKWLYIEYENRKSELSKYWIGIKDIDIKYESILAVSLHIFKYTQKDITLYIKNIRVTKIVEGTYQPINKTLVENISLNPENYDFIFGNVANLHVLNYLIECNRLSGQPSLDKNFTLVQKIDGEKFHNGIYKLDDEQFRQFVASFSEKTKRKENEPKSQELALNVLSIAYPKGLHVLAYKKILFNVAEHILQCEDEIKICSEFNLDGEVASVRKFLDADEIYLLDDFEVNAEIIKNKITKNILARYNVDDRPYFICIERNVITNLEVEYNFIAETYDSKKSSAPLKAFLGDLKVAEENKNPFPIITLNKNVNLDQLLAIYNAMNFPVAYIQGPPGTGKTNTIINTILTAFFNEQTVLFASYNNHPIDSVFEKLSNLKYNGSTIPFPVLRLGRKDKVKDALLYIKELYEKSKNISVYEKTLARNKDDKIERTKQLVLLLQKHQEAIDLSERKETLEAFLQKTDNMELRLKLEGQQLSQIKKRLEEIGTVTDEDALSLLENDTENFLKYMNFISAAYIKKLSQNEYENLRKILEMENTDAQVSAFNKYLYEPENVSKLLKIFPVIATTCISARKIGTPQIYFDMTIIDEASQCDQATALLPILRGNKLMLVGDPQQLNPVITLDKNINYSLKKKYNISEEYDYIKNSVYKTFLTTDSVSEEILLHCHYRCAKEIIEFSNKKYYNEKLEVFTKSTAAEPLVFCDVKSNYTTTKNTAAEEADKVVYFAENFLTKNKTVGIITPFRNQKELIDEKLRDRNLQNKITCGTVHAFQGDEKDAVIFSVAVTPDTNKKTYDWLKGNKELLNVAVSRPKEKLVVLANEDAVELLHEKTKDSGVDDLYDLVNYVKSKGTSRVISYEAESRALGVKAYTTETENQFLTTLNHAMSTISNVNGKYFIEEQVKISNVFRKHKLDGDLFYKGSFDFVIFKREGRSKIPVMAIELNGKEHYTDERRKLCDGRKKQICQNHNFELITVANSYARRYNYIKQILLEYFN